MKVLWFTNIMMPAMDRRAGRRTLGSGHWMTMLAEALAGHPEIELMIATVAPNVSDERFVDQGIHYAILAQHGGDGGLADRRGLAKCKTLVEQWQPDLVHVHGAERFFGLLSARKLIDVPVAISIQGLIGACREVSYGTLSPLEIFWRVDRLRDLLRGRGILWGKRALGKLACQEREIIAGNRYFLGRTAWDRSQIGLINPQAVYFHAGELLRPAFHHHQWTLPACQRQTLFCTNAGHPRRGVETLLDAMAILKNDFPAMRLRLAGDLPERSGYGRYLRRRICMLGLAAQVDFTGYMAADKLAEALCQSHVFACPSLIENSPNSLCEAMLLGLPCVASAAGGIPSLLDDGQTGFLFPLADAGRLAGRLQELFTNDALSCRMGAQAHEVAHRRHKPDVVVSQTLAAYRTILNVERSIHDGRAAPSRAQIPPEGGTPERTPVEAAR